MITHSLALKFGEPKFPHSFSEQFPQSLSCPARQNNLDRARTLYTIGLVESILGITIDAEDSILWSRE
jgi:hypothetical protein